MHTLPKKHVSQRNIQLAVYVRLFITEHHDSKNFLHPTKQKR